MYCTIIIFWSVHTVSLYVADRIDYLSRYKGRSSKFIVQQFYAFFSFFEILDLVIFSELVLAVQQHFIKPLIIRKPVNSRKFAKYQFLNFFYYFEVLFHYYYSTLKILTSEYLNLYLIVFLQCILSFKIVSGFLK